MPEPVPAPGPFSVASIGGMPMLIRTDLSGHGAALMVLPGEAAGLATWLRSPEFDCPTGVMGAQPSLDAEYDPDIVVADFLRALVGDDDEAPVTIFGFSAGTVLASHVAGRMAALRGDVRLILANPLHQPWPPTRNKRTRVYRDLERRAAADPDFAARLDRLGKIVPDLKRGLAAGLRIRLFASAGNPDDRDDADALGRDLGVEAEILPTSEHDILVWMRSDMTRADQLRRRLSASLRRTNPNESHAGRAARVDGMIEGIRAFRARHPSLRAIAAAM